MTSRTTKLSSQLKDELLVCGICYNHYTVRVRPPKLLTCSHTFCAPCIESCASGDSGTVPTSFTCPVCRQETPLHTDGSAGLPNNFSLISLIEILQAQRRNNNAPVSPASEPVSPQSQCSSPVCSAASPDGSSVGTPRVTFALSSSELESSPESCQQQSPCRSPKGQCEPMSPKGQGGPVSPVRRGSDTVTCQCAVRPPAFNPDYSSDASVGTDLPHSPSCPHFVQPTEPVPKPCTRHPLPPTQPAEPIRPAEPPGPAQATRPIQPIQPAQPTRPPRPTRPARRTQPAQHMDGQTAMVSPIRRNFLSASMPFRRRTPTKPTRRRSFHHSTSALEALKCTRKIGCYSDVPMTVNAFKKPTKVAVSEDGEIAVLDGVYMTVQLFTSAGEHISMFTVPGASSVCFVGSEKIIVGTHQGIEVYSHDGTPLNSMRLESVVTVSMYKFGFIVCQPKQLTIFRASMTIYRKIKRRHYHSMFRRSLTFKSLCDVTMTTQRDIAVLDGGSGKVYVLDQDGYVLLSFNPRRETCGPLQCPHSIAVDNWNSLYISDTGSRRVLKFSPQGMFSRCVLSFGLHTVPSDLQARGLTATGGHLVVVVGGHQFAEVRMYAV